MPDYQVTHISGEAHGVFSSASEKITLLRNSRLSIDLNKKPSDNIASNYRSVREHLTKGRISSVDGILRVAEDIPNLSPSEAGVFVSGKMGSGWEKWKLQDGRLLDALRTGGTCGTKRVLTTTRIVSPSFSTMKLNESEVIAALGAIQSEVKKDPHSRWLAWNHCYQFFRHPDVKSHKKDAALHLGFYLASWGMFRNSVLLEKNHLFYEPLVEIVATNAAQKMCEIPTTDDEAESRIQTMCDLSAQIEQHLQAGGVSPTTTLITKILLGTTACIPAIDTEARKALKQIGLYSNAGNGLPGKATLEALFTLARNHATLLERGAKILSESGFDEYPPMKVLDMILWKLGDHTGGTDAERNSTK